MVANTNTLIDMEARREYDVVTACIRKDAVQQCVIGMPLHKDATAYL